MAGEFRGVNQTEYLIQVHLHDRHTSNYGMAGLSALGYRLAEWLDIWPRETFYLYAEINA